ncbi:c-type cytochrome [Rhodoferax sp.]|uniref:c-type cytochrome n=1 Tax=Rhodoferax sp. TaxID=50421 RepID=UPI00374CA276
MKTSFEARPRYSPLFVYLQRVTVLLVAASIYMLASTAKAQSVSHGQALYAAHCAACHTVDTNNTGPMHLGVVGRKAGSVQGFDYTPALRHSQLVWTRANLLAWLEDPEALIPGQGMDFSLPAARDREDIVAYLATLTKPGK